MGKKIGLDSRVRDFIKGSPLAGAFLVEAMGRYSDELLKNEEAVKRAMEHSFIAPAAWLRVAKDWRAAAKDIIKG